MLIAVSYEHERQPTNGGTGEVMNDEHESIIPDVLKGPPLVPTVSGRNITQIAQLEAENAALRAALDLCEKAADDMVILYDDCKTRVDDDESVKWYQEKGAVAYCIRRDIMAIKHAALRGGKGAV